MPGNGEGGTDEGSFACGLGDLRVGGREWESEAASLWEEAQHSEVWPMIFGDRGLIFVLCSAVS